MNQIKYPLITLLHEIKRCIHDDIKSIEKREHINDPLRSILEQKRLLYFQSAEWIKTLEQHINFSVFEMALQEIKIGLEQDPELTHALVKLQIGYYTGSEKPPLFLDYSV